MRIALVAVGRLKSGPERDLVDRYAGRIAPMLRGLGLRGFEMSDFPESRARSATERQDAEAIAILDRVGEGPLVAFDERGDLPTSNAFAATLGVWRDAGRSAATFAIGGADGLSPRVRKNAALVLSFGRLTLPHQLVRVLVLEQLYRAMTILSGHPYHREG